MSSLRISRTLAVALLFLCAIVALLVFPVFTRQRGSRVDTCSTHLRQLGLALLTYAEDWNGRLPNSLTWPADLKPYQPDSRFLHCPEDTRPGERSYDMLQRWGYQRLPGATASRLIVLYDTGRQGPEYRHNDGLWIGHGDGHAKWYSRAEMPPDVILRGLVPAPRP